MEAMLEAYQALRCEAQEAKAKNDMKLFLVLMVGAGKVKAQIEAYK